MAIKDDKKEINITNIKTRFMVNFLDRIIGGFKDEETKVRLNMGIIVNCRYLGYEACYGMTKLIKAIAVGKNILGTNTEMVLGDDKDNEEKTLLDSKEVNAVIIIGPSIEEVSNGHDNGPARKATVMANKKTDYDNSVGSTI